MENEFGNDMKTETKKVVRVIEASEKTEHSANPGSKTPRRRVAAYARVSTEKDEQFSSYEAQIDYYRKLIKSRPDWKLVRIYTDEGITGTNVKQRTGFKRMVKCALAGKIDLIVTKSVSRFARNTVDSLVTIRKLKEAGCEVFFEKENIYTMDSKGELLITIMSSIAQEESRSISENVTWGIRRRMAKGLVTVPFSHFLGYGRGPDGDLIIEEEGAATVRRIYERFLRGDTPYMIAKELTQDGVPTPAGKALWYASTVTSILQNEKYKGDALLQKTYVADFLTKEKRINKGERTQYFISGHHEAIISPAVFDRVQQEMKRRGPKRFRAVQAVGEET